MLLLLSGGSNLKVLEKMDKNILNDSAVTKYVLDERFSSDPTENNSKQIEAIGVHIQPTIPREGETLDSFAARFNTDLKNWIKTHPGGKIICTLGMGSDGHIAGISPMFGNPEAFTETFNTNELVVGYSGGLTPPQRVTVTPKFLTESVDTVIGLVLGESKRDAFASFEDKETPPNMHPVQILHKATGDVVIMTNIQPK